MIPQNVAMADEEEDEEYDNFSLASDMSEGTTSDGDSQLFKAEARDEVKEVEKLLRVETRGVVFSRYAVTTMLVITAVVVSVTVYRLLTKENTEDYTGSVRAQRIYPLLS